MIQNPKSRLTVLTILTVVSLVLAACGRPGVAGAAVSKPAQGETAYRVADGPAAPDWTLETLDGGTFRLADHRGDVVVMFFMASWCTSCVLEARALVQLHEQYADQGLTIVAINVEPQKNEEGLRQFRQVADDAPYTWVFDDKFTVSQRYDVKALDTTIIIDRAGHIAYRDAFVSPYATLEEAVREWL